PATGGDRQGDFRFRAGQQGHAPGIAASRSHLGRGARSHVAPAHHPRHHFHHDRAHGGRNRQHPRRYRPQSRAAQGLGPASLPESSLMTASTVQTNINGAHVMAAALKRHGVEVIFGQAIPAALFLAAPHYGIRQIGYRTENAGAVMADAYARVSHKVPVVTAQNGPAATLLVAGLAEALKASIPVVAIVQDVARPFADKNAFQELDHLELFKGSAKWIRRVADVNRIDDYIDMAFTAAASGRPGPAVLIAPIDMFLDTPAPGANNRLASLGTFPLDRSGPDPVQVEEAARLLANAERPLVIAGGGVHVSDACAELSAL